MPIFYFSIAVWQNYLVQMSQMWLLVNRDWLNFEGPLHVMLFENLKKDPLTEMKFLFDFLNIHVSRSDLLCMSKNSQGIFKRKKIEVLDYDPYPDNMRKSILSYHEILERDLQDFRRKIIKAS